MNAPATFSRRAIDFASGAITVKSRWALSIVLLLFISSAIYLFAEPKERESGPVGAVLADNDWTASSAVRTELYYGAGGGTRGAEIDLLWQQYLDEVVTPRFPEGLTVLEGVGQWRVRPGEHPRRNRSRIMILIHPATEEKERLIEEIREQWKEMSGHRSVLRVSVSVDASY